MRIIKIPRGEYVDGAMVLPALGISCLSNRIMVWLTKPTMVDVQVPVDIYLDRSRNGWFVMVFVLRVFISRDLWRRRHAGK